MISEKTLLSLEYDKILLSLTNFSVLKETKNLILKLKPQTDYDRAQFLLNKTSEAYKLIYTHCVGNVEFFDEMFDETERAKRGSILTMGELLKVARVLRSSRIAVSSIDAIIDDEITIFKDLVKCIYFDKYLENEITTKILSDEQIADTASDKLYQIRQNIKRLNEKIREKLTSYMRAGANKFMQDNVVSIRSGRYVIPVKSECRSQVKGFIHDHSASGSTVFIEPAEILELNNDLKSETINEKVEIERILSDLSSKVGLISEKIDENILYLTDIDCTFSKAQYAHTSRSVCPFLSSNGVTQIIGGRHPLINKDKVVPVSIEFGKDYKIILITGPNTGGKTVTLKLTGLLTLMSMSGMFIPAKEGTIISVFSKIFVDIGDEQSIEQNLSTFSSHLKNLISITNNVDGNSLVLIDEIGAGTDPEEGSALAQAIIKRILDNLASGVITTHYTALKEFAYNTPQIVNGSMEFDGNTFAPLYKLNIGMPGVSNAIEIARRLGLDEDIVNSAKSLLSGEKIEFDSVLLQAEKIKSTAEEKLNELNKLLEDEKVIYQKLKEEKDKLTLEREKFLVKAKAESRKLINDKLEVAEDLLSQMKEIFDKDVYTESDLVKMSTLKNKIDNEKYLIDSDVSKVSPYKEIEIEKLKVGDKVYVTSLESEGEVSDIKLSQKQIWVMVGSLRVKVKIDDIRFISITPKNTKKEVSIKKPNTIQTQVKTEINVIGLNSDDALMEVRDFIDKSVVANLEEVRIVHGKGMRILSKAIHNYLKTESRVDSFRFGKYGEGEDGVTIVKLK